MISFSEFINEEEIKRKYIAKNKVLYREIEVFRDDNEYMDKLASQAKDIQGFSRFVNLYKVATNLLKVKELTKSNELEFTKVRKSLRDLRVQFEDANNYLESNTLVSAILKIKGIYDRLSKHHTRLDLEEHRRGR